MRFEVFDTKQRMGENAAAAGADVVRRAIAARSAANVILATGASQFEMLSALAATKGIDWSRVTFFHLDEYVGMPITHPASFRKYLKERFVDQLPTPPAAFHYIDAEGNCTIECERLGGLISKHPIDVAFIGIGENGHLAFNDPPADFETEQPYLVVELDEACRRQQLGEGWFPTLDDVPRQAISMSIRQILKSTHIVCTAPDQRKAKAVKGAVDGPITATVPASILQTHDAATLYLDRPAASLLSPAT
jgi:glucosamine-6-phosphate deaminase